MKRHRPEILPPPLQEGQKNLQEKLKQLVPPPKKTKQKKTLNIKISLNMVDIHKKEKERWDLTQLLQHLKAICTKCIHHHFCTKKEAYNEFQEMTASTKLRSEKKTGISKYHSAEQCHIYAVQEFAKTHTHTQTSSQSEIAQLLWASTL